MRRFLDVGLVALAIYVLCIDGALRLLTGQQNLIIVRDALLWGMAAIALLSATLGREKLRVPPMSGLVAVFVLMVLVQVVNPSAYGLQATAVAVRQHLEWVPLFFLGYWGLNSVKRLRMLGAVLLVAASANGAMGFVQFSISPEALASWGPGYSTLSIGDQNLAPEARAARNFVDASGRYRVRPPALGPDAGFGGVVGMIALPVALAFALLGGLGPARRLALAAGFAGVALAILTSQTRSALLAALAATVAFVLVSFFSRRLIPALSVVVVVGVVVMAAAPLLGGDQGSAFRGLDSIAPGNVSETFGTERGTSLALLPKYAAEYPLGAGLGTLGAGSRYRPVDTRQLSGETNFNYLLLELGIPGLLAAIVLMSAVLARMAVAARRARSRDAGLVLGAMAGALAGYATIWFAGPISATSLAGFFWVAAGAAAWWYPARSRATSAAARPVAAGLSRG